MPLISHPEGNYQFLPGIEPYSSGVIAMPGYEIIHATLRQAVSYRQGFEFIDRYLQSQGRPRAALCAIELRSPAPFSFEGFAGFNREYVSIIKDWNIMVDGQNPIARTNVAPVLYPPSETVLYAFSYTMPLDEIIPPTFVVAGAGEVGSLRPEDIVRAGETSVEAMREKAAYVMGIMEKRLMRLDALWSGVTCVDIYTAHSFEPFLATEILPVMGPAAAHGVRWYYTRPPITGLEYEMDMRGIRREIIVNAPQHEV